MAEITLSAKRRTVSRKSANNELRKEGKVPGIYYHKKDQPIPLETMESSLKPIVYTSETHIITLTLDDKSELSCILKNVQFDPVTERIVHFDLLGISRDEEIEIEIPITYVGNPVGIKQGGVLQQVIHRLLVKCLPADIPEHVEIKIEKLNVGDAIHVSDLKLEKIKILNSPESVLVTVVTPKVEKEPTPAAEGEEAKEPEVISKGKAEKEEE